MVDAEENVEKRLDRDWGAGGGLCQIGWAGKTPSEVNDKKQPTK